MEMFNYVRAMNNVKKFVRIRPSPIQIVSHD